MKHVTDRPLAVQGLLSYRYKGQYGWIMIGAKDNVDALRQAKRSTSREIIISNLQIWDGTEYVTVELVA